MLRKIFINLSVIGIGFITILSFLLPSNPYEIIQPYTINGFEKPVWLCYMVSGSVIYLIILWYIYGSIDVWRYKNERRNRKNTKKIS